MSPKTSILIAIVMLAGLAFAIWAREARADTSECSAATERDALAAFDALGLPPNEFPTVSSKEFVAGYCARAALDLATPPREACEATAPREYATLAEMVGIPPDDPIYAKEQEEYVTLVCLHEALVQNEQGR